MAWDLICGLAGTSALSPRRAAPRPSPAPRPRDGASSSRDPTPLSTPTTRPAPAARPIARSAGVSPIIAVLAGHTPVAWQSARSIAGSGFTPTPSSPHAIAATSPARPARAERRLGRRPVVGRRDGDEPPSTRAAPNSAGRSADRHRRRDRIRLEPGRLDRPPRRRDARAPAPDDRGDRLPDLGHRRDRERRAGQHPPAGRVEPDRREHVAADRPPRRPSEALAQRRAPSRPHRVEVDERAVLVEDDEVDPVEERAAGTRIAMQRERSAGGAVAPPAVHPIGCVASPRGVRSGSRAFQACRRRDARRPTSCRLRRADISELMIAGDDVLVVVGPVEVLDERARPALPLSANFVLTILFEGVRRVVAGDLLQVGVAARRVRRQLDLDELDLGEEPLRLVEVADAAASCSVLGRAGSASISAASLPA